MATPKIKAVFFDFMGTCLDWHSSVAHALSSAIPRQDASKLALEWRQCYFLENSNRVSQNLGPEDIDITLARTLEVVLDRLPEHKPHLDAQTKVNLIRAWHSQKAWPEVSRAINTIRTNLGLEVFVHANGTTRLQLDLVHSSGLEFDMLFSSQLLGAYKPKPEAYEKGLQLINLQPQEVVLVAAHAYDLRGAKFCEMRTIYIHRWTDDIDEDMNVVKTEFDGFLENMNDLPTVIGTL